MLANSQLPPSYDPGYFHLLFLGVYCQLEKFAGFNFQGHWRHGGSPPRCPAHLERAVHATRFVTISYPPGKMMSGSSRLRFAELLVKSTNGPDAIYVTPEMMDVKYVSIRPHSGSLLTIAF
jgi:hypothetical protein